MAISRREMFAVAGAAGARAALPVQAQQRRADVKITSVETFRLPLALLVKVTASDGTAGWGECSSDNRPVMETFIHHGLKEHVIGADPFNVEPVWDAMFYDNHDQGPGGALANSIAGIDIALWDLKGKMLGLPVYKLLGGSYRDRIKAYGSFGVGYGERMTIDEAVAQARKFVGLGFHAVKLRMQIREFRQNPDPDLTLPYARAVRKAIGPDVELIIDINNGYTAQRAIEVGRQLHEEVGVRFYEDPVSDQYQEEYAAVAAALHDVGIIAGEKEYTRWQLRSLIVHGNPDYLNPDIIKAGGFTEMKKIAAIAQAFEKPMICHNTRPTVSTAATLHLVASISNAGPFVEYPEVDHFAELMRMVPTDVHFEDGYLRIPDSPGIGVHVDEAAVRSAAA